MKEKIKKMYDYLQGTLRYEIYHGPMRFLIRDHIIEQFKYRVALIKSGECYTSGSCTMCGCETPALQFANKSCDKPCYPKMINKEGWDKLKKDEQKV